MKELSENEKYNRCIDDIGELLHKTVRILQTFERDQIRIHGFTSSQCHLLLTVLRHGPLTMNEISGRMKLEVSTITRIMDILVRDGLLSRQRTPADKRVVEAILTESGRVAARRLQEGIAEDYRNVISNLPRGRVREVMGSMELLLDALEKSHD